MEVILLWLDDLDDLVCAAAQLAERLRWPSLELALGAALFLVIAQVETPLETWETLASSIAVGGLLLWVLGSSLAARQGPGVLTSSAGTSLGA